MDDRMLAGMAEATRLTRAGQLIEATALIQRTLQGTLVPEAVVDPTARPTDAPIDVTFQVIDPAPRPRERSTQGPVERTSTSLRGEFRQPDLADAARASARASVAGLDVPPFPQADWPAQAPSPIPPPPLRGGRVVVSMPDRARREVEAEGQFVTGSYTNQAGTRTYKLYIPSGYHGQALPLVVMLHGCTQTPDDFAAGTRMNVLAERDGFFVVYPAQAPAANPSRCWNWFQASDQQRDQGEPSLIAGITHHISSTYQVNPRRVYVAGLSAGGAMAMIMGVTYPDLYAAIGVHSGLAYGAAHDLPSAFTAMQHGRATPLGPRDSRFPDARPCPRVVPTIVFHGDRDTTVHQRNGDQVLAQWATISAGGSDSVAGTKLHGTVQQGQVPAGHAYTRSIYHDDSGQAVMEQWLVHGAGHAWSGGSPTGSFTDPKGPDAAQEMVRFFSEHPQCESTPAGC